MPVRKNAWSVKYLTSLPTSPDLASETVMNDVPRQISVARNRQIQACSYQRSDHLDTQSFKKALALLVQTRMFVPLLALMQPSGSKVIVRPDFGSSRKYQQGSFMSLVKVEKDHETGSPSLTSPRLISWIVIAFPVLRISCTLSNSCSASHTWFSVASSRYQASGLRIYYRTAHPSRVL
jgi:hypothetical protein